MLLEDFLLAAACQLYALGGQKVALGFGENALCRGRRGENPFIDTKHEKIFDFGQATAFDIPNQKAIGGRRNDTHGAFFQTCLKDFCHFFKRQLFLAEDGICLFQNIHH